MQKQVGSPSPGKATVDPQQALSLENRVSGAVLSFLVPGLGQIYQGTVRNNWNRLSKGIFFLLTLYGMFFYGMWLGNWHNVYLPNPTRKAPHTSLFGKELKGLPRDLYTRLPYLGQFWIGVAAWPALWHYYHPEPEYRESLNGFQRPLAEEPRLEDPKEVAKEKEIILADTDKGKMLDIAWVYTVIAGVLNILVIYDAWAGPMHTRKEEEAAPATQGAVA